MDTLWQGLNISLIGLGLTFAALGFFIVAIVALQRLFPARAPAARPGAPMGGARSSRLEAEEDEEIAAAIAVALSHLRSLEACRGGLGESLTAGRGRWWAAGRGAAAPGKVPRSQGSR